MANASLRFDRMIVNIEDYKNRPVSAHEYFLEFTITVDTDGCFSIYVALFDHDSWSGKDQIASTNDALLKCYCFDASVPRTFKVMGASPAPDNSAMPPPSDATPLTGLTGSWPESDGPFDNVLELFAQIKLFSCDQPACGTDKDCGTISARSLGQPIGLWTTPQVETDVVNGTGVDEGIELINKAGGAVLSAATGGVAQKPSQSPNEVETLALAKMQRTMLNLPARVRRLERMFLFPSPTYEEPE